MAMNKEQRRAYGEMKQKENSERGGGEACGLSLCVYSMSSSIEIC